ncbi:ubiquitin thioesterase Zranb1 [Lepeophtheirus salmonis]|nr:ubiquitin thioesterase Zranb1-like [Lepeophtheirus salmonis]XP_040576779.1 ubiquitin thioesterase Zranb1-like [Lepeophtheirus salmonis]XP_040576780.1 ubiquitin thioesterase Zranb1-like [Lepeophtheirus salmonis]XP_040576782.1 ubiquitin thioesterase Zranb1-like [Lepeophtheirus salmonis]
MQDGRSSHSEETEELNHSCKKWSCNLCTYENWKSSTKCVMCHHNKCEGNFINTSATKSGSSSLRRIKSPNGDIHKLNNQNNQGAMATSWEVTSQANNNCNEKWSCSLCTYSNWPRSLRCVQCLTTRVKSSSSPLPTQQSSATSSMNVITDELLHISINKNNQYNKTTPSSMGAVSRFALDNERNCQKSPIIPSSPPPSCSILEGSTRKWICSVCTFENWPRTLHCTLCDSVKRSDSYNCKKFSATSDHYPGGAGSSSRKERSLSPTIGASNNNFDYEKRLRQLRRRMRESDRSWLTACMGIVEGDMIPVEAYLNGGGDPTRKLTNPEVALLNRGNLYEAGHTLVHLAIKCHREEMLATLLSNLKGSPASGAKCVPSYVAPDLGAAIRRHIASAIRQRKGSFPCYYINEWATYSLPPEIDDLPPVLQEQLYSEIMDRDAQKELEEGFIINWNPDLQIKLGSRLHALWNRSAGDCLLDSILQSTWGVFDRDNTLRKAMSDSLHEAGHIFYPRWKEWETQQALELDFTLVESQWEEDWSVLLNLASQPGAALEQLHVFTLAHVLKRPIIIYGVKYVKSWRGENLGYARFEGVYLPLFLEPSACSRSPIALGYTRGHFCSLVPPEPEISVSKSTLGAGIEDLGEHHDEKSTFLPLMTYDRKLLPVHFLRQDEIGREEVILRQWMDVCRVNFDPDLLVARQRIRKPPLLVAQMTEEWLNHYRKLAQSARAPFSVASRHGNSSPGGSSSGAVMSSGSGGNVTSPSKVATKHRGSPGLSTNQGGYSSDGDSDEE